MSEAAMTERWGWAIVHTPRPLADREPCTLTIVAPGSPDSPMRRHGPETLTIRHRPPHSADFERLTGTAWNPVGSWRAANPSLLDQDRYWQPDAPPATDRDEWQIMRLRRSDTGSRGAAPVPYVHDLQWAFDDPAGGQHLVDDSEWHGGHYPGWVRLWVQNLEREVEGTHLLPADGPDPAARRRIVEEATATFDEFNTWLRGQLRDHGWPRADADSLGLAELLLHWVIGYTDHDFRVECRNLLAHSVSAGDADPEHLAALTATLT